MPRRRRSEADKTWAVAAAICELVAAGASLSASCDKLGVKRRTIRDQLAADPLFASEYAAAVTMREAVLFDEIGTLASSALEVAAAAEARGENAQAAITALRVEIDAKKWILSKLSPQRYGDRTVLAGDAEGRLLPEAPDTSKLALLVLNILGGTKDEAARQAVVEHEPVEAWRGSPPKPLPPPATEPTRVFDTSNGQLVRTLPPDEPRQPSGTVLAPATMRAATWPGRIAPTAASPAQQAVMQREAERLRILQMGREVDDMPRRVVRFPRGGDR